MIAKQIDDIVRRLQWPCTLGLLAATPLIVAATLALIVRSANYPWNATLFWGGVAALIAVARTKWFSTKILLTLIAWERRITQAIVSFVLLQPSSMAVRWMRSKLPIPSKAKSTTGPASDWLPPSFPWLQEGNWLLVTSPYFLPTASMVLWLISAFLLQQMLRSFVLGVGVAYHLLSVYLQLRFAITPSANAGAAAHGGDRVVSTRGDAVLADRRWLWLFLIPMNLLVFGAVYAFALSGFSGLSQFMSDLWKPIQFLLDRFLLSKST